MGAVNSHLFKPIGPLGGAGGLLQQHHRRQILNLPDTVLLLVARAAQWHHLFMHQVFTHRTGPMGCTEMDGRVQRHLGEVEGFMAGGDVHRHIRVTRRKIHQARNQPTGAQGGQHGQVEQPATVGPGHGFLGGARELLQHRAHVGGVHPARVG